VEQYQQNFANTNPLPYFSMTAGKAYSLRELVGDVETNPFYQEFLHPAGLDDLIMFYVEEPGGFRCWVSIARREDMGAFSTRDLADCEWLAAQMGNALTVYSALKQLELERDIYASALRNLNMGYVLLDSRGQIIRTDDAADKLLTKNPEIYLKDSRIRVGNDSKNRELQELIQAGLEARGNEFSRALNIIGSQNLGILIKNAPDSPILSSRTAPHLVVYINESTAPTETPQARIAELYELSQTEAALVVELVRGNTLAEAAANIHITEQTARTYSKRIFNKTGTRRQAELVRLILTSVALVA
jgi:DNA-binding CsgD family transcriptional regulator/PAS domain-containing protein